MNCERCELKPDKRGKLDQQIKRSIAQENIFTGADFPFKTRDLGFVELSFAIGLEGRIQKIFDFLAQSRDVLINRYRTGDGLAKRWTVHLCKLVFWSLVHFAGPTAFAINHRGHPRHHQKLYRVTNSFLEGVNEMASHQI